jgi:hypothetical protein
MDTRGFLSRGKPVGEKKKKKTSSVVLRMSEISLNISGH